MAANGERIHAFLLRGGRGPLLAVYHRPDSPCASTGDVLVVPPFGEELNRCRSMLTMQADAFARMGVGTLILDLHGTGDSSGEFVEATWEQWLTDLRQGIEWLRTSGNGCTSLLGVRLGAILASELAVEDPRLATLLLWQPVVDGKAFFTQFLRIRVAAEMETGGVRSTEQLRAMAEADGLVEVGGYQVGRDLVRSIDQRRLPDPAGLRDKRVRWFEVLPAADSNVGRANVRASEIWRVAGVDVHVEKVVGPSFWQVHEREVAPLLIDVTARCVKALAAEAPLMESETRPAVSSASLEFQPAGAAEYPVNFRCGADDLVGIVHRPLGARRLGVVIVVAGGPQYRAGAHRQFVTLGRALSSRGFPVMRFDMRGMGDSSGEYRGYQSSEDDLGAAVGVLLQQHPELDSVVLLGECESASGILFYAFRDDRIGGLVLINPWVRTEGGRAEVIIKHYYFSRVASRDFWRKVLSGRFELSTALRSLGETLRAYVKGRGLRRQVAGDAEFRDLPLPVKTATGLRRFPGPALLLMSGNDYIAREFDEVTKSSAAWQGLLDSPRLLRRDVEGADHTFSRHDWKAQAHRWIGEWIEQQ